MTKPLHPSDDDDDSAVPRDLDDFFKILTRRLADSDPDSWRRCTSRRCHRTRRCVEPDVRCYTSAAMPPMTEEECAEAKASLQRALRARMQSRGEA